MVEVDQQPAVEEETFRLVLGNETDLPTIYDLIRKQFPKEEIYHIRNFIQMVNNNRYKILMYLRESDNQMVGYATTYSIPTCQTVWLDLFAVLPQYQSMGYGQKLFDAVYQKYCGPFDGLLLCAEKVDPNDPEKAKIQRRRLAFYEKVGAHLLKTQFLLPIETGGFPMHLLYKPKRGRQELSRENQLEIVHDMFDYCYGHIKHRQQLLAQFKDTMVDEVFKPHKKK